MSALPRVTLILAGSMMLAASPAPSAAQEVGTLPVPLVEVSAGYTLLRGFDEKYPAGWYFSGGGNLTDWFGLVGEASGSYRSEDMSITVGTGSLQISDKRQVYAFMVGPRFFHKAGRVVPFGQVLAGVAHRRIQQTETRAGHTGLPAGVSTWNPSYSDFALQPGGGVAVYLTERVGLRVAGDYRCTVVLDDGAEAINELRFLAGFTFHWGTR
jgi:hypothetical protein